jgi:A/G-specific adenine glycosylase
MALSEAPSPRRLRRWLAPRLLHWFAQHRRELPWRHDRDPYRIWVSEAMLQQTQLATVVPYFERFVAAFPTIADLAAADEQEVLKRWEGLGYYRRARDLHQAAQQIVTEHDGEFPRDPAACQALPGIGRYMAGAVLSQAFDQRLPIVEANSKRVLCRLFGQEGDPQTGPVQRWLWQTAESLLPRKTVGAFNQALMELGALICTPKAPRCDKCPLVEQCVARRRGRQEQIPASPPAAQIVEVQEAAVVVRRGLNVLLVQRPKAGRWAGMWEFPHAELEDGETAPAAAARIARQLSGIEIGPAQPLGNIRHNVTRFRITMACFAARRRSGAFRSEFYAQARWLRPDQLGDFPVSRPQRILADQIRAELESRL